MDVKLKGAMRQVHLDFHTSPDIPGIGSRFSKENFQAALKAGNVDSITVFAKCHHSMCYYPTKIGTMHPHLDFDLTGAMVDAAHEIGVRAPIYITAGWSDEDAKAHPEWRAVSKEGKYITTGAFDPAGEGDQPKKHCAWQLLCLNDGEYAEHIYALTEEVCRRYSKVDGLFFDICIIGDVCYCETCKKGMREMGLDPENDGDARKYYVLKRQTFMKKCTDIMRKYHPDATIFFNSGGADQYRPQYHGLQTHFEMEDLPTAWGGYDKLPLRAKFFGNTGKHYIGMTGKFHLDWGEFGGFKTKEALRAEIATMALYGAGASVGDHMHPDGEMELQTYENIGYAYRYLEQIAPFCYGGESTADIGLFLSEDRAANEGVSTILLQNQLDYGIVCDNDFAKYDTVIIPEKAVLDDDALAALTDYLDKGGKLMLMADALVKGGKFQINTGLRYLGGSEYDCDYLIPAGTSQKAAVDANVGGIATGDEKTAVGLNVCEALTTDSNADELPAAPLLCNIPGHRAVPVDAEVFAEFITPYFSRTYAHFCGHKNTPYDKTSAHYPAIAKKGNIVYLSHSLPRQYYSYGSLFHKRYFMRALNLIYGGGRIRVKGLGSQGRCTMIHQPDKSRYCINMVYASPVKRGMAEVIEDILPVYDIEVSLKMEKPVKRVYLGLTGQELNFETDNDQIRFTVPKLHCHTAVVVEY